MWPICSFSLSTILWLLGPLIIGLLTAWWVWGGRGRVDTDVSYAEPEPVRTITPAAPQPVVAPMPPPVAPQPVAAPTPPPVAPQPVAAPTPPPVAPMPVAAPPPPPPPPPPPVAPVAVAAPPAAPAAPAAAPVAAAAAVTAIGIPAAVGSADNLMQIKGIGPKLNALLNDLGVRRFDQIANWGNNEVAKVDEHLGAFTGRIERDSWIEQAGLLARGAFAEFETKFGKLDG